MQATDVKLPDNFSEGAWLDFVEQLNLTKNVTSSANITLDLDPSLAINESKMITQDIAVSAKFWSSSLKPEYKIAVLASTTEKFAYFADKLNSLLTPSALWGGWLEHKTAQAKEHPDGFNGGMAPGFTLDGQAVVGVYLPQNQNLYNGGILQATTHEFTHVVQRSILGGSMAPMECWVREGQAEYVGWHMAGRNSKAAFANYWAQMLNMITEEPGFDTVKNYSQEDFVKWFRDTKMRSMVTGCDSVDNYIFGALAYEVLYANYGTLKVNDFFLKLGQIGDKCGNGLGDSIAPCRVLTSNAFAEAFGISEDYFYKLVGVHAFNSYQWAKGVPVFSESKASLIAPLPFVQEILTPTPLLGTNTSKNPLVVTPYPASTTSKTQVPVKSPVIKKPVVKKVTRLTKYSLSLL